MVLLLVVGMALSTTRVLLTELDDDLIGKFGGEKYLFLSLGEARERRLECRIGFWNGRRASHAESNDSEVA